MGARYSDWCREFNVSATTRAIDDFTRIGIALLCSAIGGWVMAAVLLGEM